MSGIQQIPGTPKEILRATRIVFWAIIAGALMFAFVVLAVNKIQGHLMPETKKYADTFLSVAVAVAAGCLWAAFSNYKKGITPAKDSLIPLVDKLNLYRTTLVRYIALCEGAALFSIIAFFLTANYYLFVVTVIMAAAMLVKTPTRQRVIDELSLDWQQQQELE